jgi:dihydrofolate reductase
MRKLIVSMNVTLDGFMAGPNCELDWHFNYWNEEMARCAGEQLSEADTILLGRVTYNAMAKYWPSKLTDLLCPKEDIVFADMINSCRKVVFSKTLQDTTWHNSRLVKQSIKKEVTTLKQQPGKDMIIYGSGSIVAALTRLNLIDEYILWLHPVVLGKGKMLFKNGNATPYLKLKKTREFNTGVVILYYIATTKADVVDKKVLLP